MKSLIKAVARNHNNYKGWSTSKKIVVIESDDWGSICMPSSRVYEKLINQNYRINLCPYASSDSLASEEDLKQMFSAISEFRDVKGNNPIITANTVMTNPDFSKIRDSDFTKYHYEIFTETLERYPAHSGSFDLWKKGMENRLIYPQFHGREHVNIKTWLAALQNSDSAYSDVFDDGVSWLGPEQDDEYPISLRATFDISHVEEVENQKKVVREGLSLFESVFGYKSKSFIAPNFIYHPDLNQTLYDNGVRYIQGMKYQKLPRTGKPNRKIIRHFMGERNNLGQHYLVRNCVFEPSLNPDNHDNVGECMKGIQNAFFWRKPAIITTHRLNFIGYIHPENRERNLRQFRELLRLILKKWPDVEFLTSVELGDLIAVTKQSEYY